MGSLLLGLAARGLLLLLLLLPLRLLFLVLALLLSQFLSGDSDELAYEAVESAGLFGIWPVLNHRKSPVIGKSILFTHPNPVQYVSMAKAIPLDVVRRRLNEIDSRAGELRAELDTLSSERDALSRLLEQAVEYEGEAGPPKKHAARPDATTAKILSFVTEHPGIPVGVLCEELKDQIDSEASDRARVIYNTAFNMANRGYNWKLCFG